VGREFNVAAGRFDDDKSGFSPLIRERVLSFLKEADVIVVVFDGRAGTEAGDKNAYLRRG